MDDPPIRRVGSRIAYENPWLTVREDDIVLADGTESIYGVVLKPDFVAVLARDEGGFWLVNQYRYAIDRRLWELPQGAWAPGKSGPAQELAAAELHEEAGLTADRWTHLGRLFHAHGASPTAFDVFLAEGLHRGDAAPEQTEQDIVHAFFTDAEVIEMIRAGTLCDAPSLASLALYRLHIDERMH